MARSPQSFNKKQREKEKAKKKKEKRERMEARKERRNDGEAAGGDIDWSLAPVNTTLGKDDEALKAETKKDAGGDEQDAERERKEREEQ